MQNGINRRKLLRQAGAAAAVAAGALASPSAAFAQSSGFRYTGSASAPASVTNARVLQSFENPGNRVQRALAIRDAAAQYDSSLPVPPHTTNGDEQRYSDHSASYSKVLLQDDICVVNAAAWASFKKALDTGNNSDFEAIIIGGTCTLNGPQGSYAFDLEAADSSQFGDAPDIGGPTGAPLVPPFDEVTSEAYGTQLVEMYWASLLRDVAFTDFPTNSTAAAACAELAGMPTYRGPRDSNGKVTPNLLFRGIFQGETIGPHISQFMITPTSMGQLPMNMLFTTYLPGIDYMQDTTTFLTATISNQ
jgi:hypothetical protein